MLTRTTAGGLLFWVLSSTPVRSAAVEGYAYLAGQSDHAGIMVTLQYSPTVPVLGGWMSVLLIIGAGFLLARKQFPQAVVVLPLIVLGWGAIATADLLDTTYTLADGSYRFENIVQGIYKIEAAKDCYVPQTADQIQVWSADVVAPPLELLELAETNQRQAEANTLMIACAQAAYFLASQPLYTFAPDFHTLVTEQWSGGEGFLPEDFDDGIVNGYQFILEVEESMPGLYYYWSVAAYPLDYGCSGRNSYYEDTYFWGYTMRGGDINGAPGHENLPYICSMEHPEIIHRSLLNIVAAEMDYNNNSLPHTFTDSLADLASGAGAGNVSFLCGALADGEFCGYQYQLEVNDCSRFGCWAFTCTAWPIVYGGDTVLSFFADTSGIIRAADIGGGPGSVDLPILPYLPEVCDRSSAFRAMPVRTHQ